MSVAVLSMPLENQTVSAELLHFHVKYDPALAPEAQFSFFQDGVRHNRLFQVDQTRKVMITLEGATFSTRQGHHGLYWLIGPDPLPDPEMDSTTRIFQLSKPPHAMKPWCFGLVVDTEDIKGILSPPIYVAKRVPSGLAESLMLEYDPESQGFDLRDGDTGNLVSLASTDLLVFAIQPGEDCKIAIGLAATPSPQPLALTWADLPVVWDSGSKPTWVDTSVTDGMLWVTFSSSGAGKMAGFQFAIQVPREGMKPMTVRSPDPILVNTTIGDG